MENNIIYFYDGSFLNLITLIDYLIFNKRKPLDIKNEETYEQNLTDETCKLDLMSDDELINKIMKNTSTYFLNILYYVFLSDEEHKELIMYYILLNGYKYGKNVVFQRNLKCINKALKTAKYVGREAHRLKGFLRFQEINNSFLYAEIEPTNNIIEILAKHFSKRLKNEFWVIEDKKRKLVCLYDKKKYYLNYDANFTLVENIKSKEEKDIEEMWKCFFKTIAIEARTNPRCQMNFMPKKYWKYIIEMSDKDETSD